MLKVDLSHLGSIYAAGLGEVLFDVYPQGPKIGGAPANFAYHTHQQGVESIVVSAVGADGLGRLARDLLAVNYLPALLPEVPYPTGAVNVTLDDKGVPTYEFLENTAYDHIPLNEEVLQVAGRTRIACFGTLAQRGGGESHHTVMAFLDAMPDEKIRVFDINLRHSYFSNVLHNYYSKEIIEESLKRTEIIKCNEDELPVLCRMAGLKKCSVQEYFKYLNDQGIFCLVFTEGARQSTIMLNDEVSVLPTPKVDAIDTVGAGDSFTAALIAHLVRGKDLGFAHRKACEVSAYVCTQEGAMPKLLESLKA